MRRRASRSAASSGNGPSVHRCGTSRASSPSTSNARAVTAARKPTGDCPLSGPRRSVSATTSFQPIRRSGSAPRISSRSSGPSSSARSSAVWPASSDVCSNDMQRLANAATERNAPGVRPSGALAPFQAASAPGKSLITCERRTSTMLWSGVKIRRPSHVPSTRPGYCRPRLRWYRRATTAGDRLVGATAATVQPASARRAVSGATTPPIRVRQQHEHPVAGGRCGFVRHKYSPATV